MINTQDITPYSEFDYWFEFIDTIPPHHKDDLRCYNVYKEGTKIGCIQEYISPETLTVPLIEFEDAYVDTYKPLQQNILNDFNKFSQTRPEHKIGCRLDLPSDYSSQDAVDKMITKYENLLLGAFVFNRWRSNRGEDPDKWITTFNESCLKWLDQTDFYIAPSSTKYHDNCPSGLLYHSLKVYDLMLDLRKAEAFKNVSFASIIITSLTHDWCKIGLYESYYRNVKNDVTGQWEQVLAYKHNQKGIPLGHGTTSMFLASKFFNLTPEEALAIRWHMSYWAVSPGEDYEMALACDTYPIVELIQFADQLSTRPYSS